MIECLRLAPLDSPSVVEKFYKFVRVSLDRSWEGTPCHEWTGGKSRGGNRWSKVAFYGTFNPGSWFLGGIRAHVFIAWLAGIIPTLRVPKGMNLDHRCHNALCVNEWHIELVSKEVNQQRKRPRGTLDNESALCHHAHVERE